MQYPQVQFTYDGGGLTFTPATAKQLPLMPSSPSGTRTAGGAGFRSALGKLFQRPLVRTGSFALAGLPIALDAVDQLNRDPGNTIGNVSGAGGQVVGGLGGGLAGAKLGALSPFPFVTAPLGFAVGSILGGNATSTLTRGLANAFTGMTNDELGKTIRDQERMARSQITMESERALAQMPALQLQAAWHQQQLDEAMARELRARGIGLYQQAMLGPSRVPAGTYMDSDYGSALAAIASRALG